MRIQLNGNGTIGAKSVLIQDGATDGMTTDLEGNLYLTRHGEKMVSIFNSTGRKVKDIDLSMQSPTNLALAPNGDLYVVGRCGNAAYGNKILLSNVVLSLNVR